MHFPDRGLRTTVNRHLLDDLHLAVAKAVARMPEIRDLELGIGNARCGYVCKYTSNGRNAGVVSWLSRRTTTYEPHDDIISEWKRAFSRRSDELEVQVLGVEHSWYYTLKNL